MSDLFVAYYRVSTGNQALSGLGLEAQQHAVRDYIDNRKGHLVAEFSETASGRKNDRSKLKSAIGLCRVTNAKLVISRLDRLSRNVEFVATLMDSGLDFVCVDFPEANKFTIHILAAVAEYEAGLQAERTKAVAAASRAGGRKVGNSRRDYKRCFPAGCQQASAIARREKADARARDVAPLIRKMAAEGKSHAVIADEFNATGVRPHKTVPWTRSIVGRIAKQISEQKGDGKRAPVGKAQMKARSLAEQISPLLRELPLLKAPYAQLAEILRERGIKTTWGREWSRKSIRRFITRTFKVSALRELRQP